MFNTLNGYSTSKLRHILVLITVIFIFIVSYITFIFVHFCSLQNKWNKFTFFKVKLNFKIKLKYLMGVRQLSYWSDSHLYSFLVALVNCTITCGVLLEHLTSPALVSFWDRYIIMTLEKLNTFSFWNSILNRKAWTAKLFFNKEFIKMFWEWGVLALEKKNYKKDKQSNLRNKYKSDITNYWTISYFKWTQ